MLTKEKLLKELDDASEEDIQTLLRIIDAWKRSNQSPLVYIEELMNFEYIGFDREKKVYFHRMLITEELKNRIKTLHGGVTATFIDTAMGSTLIRGLDSKIKAVTLDLSVRYLLPGEEGWLIAETTVVKKGKTIFIVEAKVINEQKKLVSIASGTFYRIK